VCRREGFREAYCEFRHPEGGTTLVFNDALFNMPHGSGPRGWMFRAMGSSGPLHMPLLARLFLLRDRAAFRSFLLSEAAREGIRHLVVAHGLVVSGNVGDPLKAAAARL
jgi:hypothetical protein